MAKPLTIPQIMDYRDVKMASRPIAISNQER
jgi:hypothetical protein